MKLVLRRSNGGVLTPNNQLATPITILIPLLRHYLLLMAQYLIGYYMYTFAVY